MEVSYEGYFAGWFFHFELFCRFSGFLQLGTTCFPVPRFEKHEAKRRPPAFASLRSMAPPTMQDPEGRRGLGITSRKAEPVICTRRGGCRLLLYLHRTSWGLLWLSSDFKCQAAAHFGESCPRCVLQLDLQPNSDGSLEAQSLEAVTPPVAAAQCQI